MAILLDNAILVTMDTQKPVLKRQKLIIQNEVIVEFGERVKTDRYTINETFNCGSYLPFGNRETKGNKEESPH